MKYFLGIDGGGTKTRALLVDSEGTQIHYAESGPSNLNAYDEQTVQTSLKEVIQACTEFPDKTPLASCLGLAGCSSSKTKQKLEGLIQSFELGHCRIVTDAEIALEGAFSGGPGILLIAGTGSICVGKSADGDIHRTGGWGWLADDAGSAGWIGQRALEAALQQNDGRMEGTTLRDAVFTKLEVTSSDEINSKLYRPTLSRSKLGEFAPSVLRLANDGDSASQSIRDKALDELEKLIRTTAKKLKGRVCEVAISGGLFLHQVNFREALQARLYDFKILEAQSTPLDGAVALARKI